MNILITGGTGFLGQAYIKQYPKNHYCVLTRKPLSTQQKTPNVTFINDLKAAYTENYDAIINLAGEPVIGRRWNTRQKKVVYDSRIKITKDLVRYIQNTSTPPKIFLTGSAVGIYGDKGSQNITEDTPIFANDFASALCKDWEECAAAAQPYTRVVALRTGIVLDAKNGALAKMLPAFRFGLGGKIGQGTHYMPWVHIVDYINAVQFILENEQVHGAVNMSAPHPVSNTDFTQILAQKLHRPAWCNISKKILFMVLGESASVMLSSHCVIPGTLLKQGFQFKYPHLRSALDNLL